MDFDDLKIVGTVASVVILVITAFLCLVMSIQYHVENVPLRVFVDGVDVYNGRSACVETYSMGSSAEVATKTGPWCQFPKEYFAGKNVVIQTAKEWAEARE